VAASGQWGSFGTLLLMEYRNGIALVLRITFTLEDLTTL
jgi:hypothetical protein